jgi:O-antigen/teichoic acid export membrane protein
MSGRGVAAVFGHALVFGLAPMLQKLVSLALLPWFSFYLGPEGYGLGDFLFAVTGFFPVLFGLELRVGYVRAHATAAPEAAARLLGATVAASAALAVAAASAFCLVWPVLERIFEGVRLDPSFRAVLALGIFLDLLNLSLLAALQARLWSKRTAVLNLAAFALSAGANILFVVGLELGAYGLFLANALASAATTTALLWTLRRSFGAWPRWREAAIVLRPLLRYSLPLWGGGLAYFVLRNVDRLALTELASLATLGVYGMAWKLSSLLSSFLLVPFQRSFDVWRFKLWEERAEPRIIADILRWLLVAAGALALALATLGADLFGALADPRFAGIALYLPLLNLAALCQCASAVTSSAFFVTARTGLWIRCFLLAALAQAALCASLVWLLGALGAALASALVQGALWAASVRFGRTLWEIPYRHGEALAIVGLATGLSFARGAFAPADLVRALLLDVGLCAAFVLAAIGLRWIRTEEWAKLRALLMKRVPRRAAP